MSRLVPSTPLDDILEKEWQSTVVSLAKQLGWWAFHTYDSRRSAHGMPDLLLVKDRVVYVELKRESRKTSRLSPEQIRVLTRLSVAGAEVYVCRPSHLDELAKVLSTKTPSARLHHELQVELGRRTP